MTQENEEQANSGEVVARGSADYRIRRYIMVALMLAFGAWFLYDGYIKYPRANEKVAQLQREIDEATAAGEESKAEKLRVELKSYSPETAESIAWQKRLGFGLPVLALIFLIFFLYRSRGAYRLADRTLHVPGHPPVPLDSITALDKGLWDRKGIAYVDYALPDGKQGKLTLDDFIYERKPTDAIVDRITTYLTPAEDAPPPAAEPQPDAVNNRSP